MSSTVIHGKFAFLTARFTLTTTTKIFIWKNRLGFSFNIFIEDLIKHDHAGENNFTCFRGATKNKIDSNKQSLQGAAQCKHMPQCWTDKMRRGTPNRPNQ